MYACPNCAGNLKFHIQSQKLRCDMCDSVFDPYKIAQEHDVEEHEDMDVTIFTCPQCGGEIYSQDEEAATFCSFCGSSTILTSRLAKEHRPKYIIPFVRTKESCKHEYRRFMKCAIFSPKGYADVRKVDGFRGIYMPYWVYDVEQTGDMALPVKQPQHREGDYLVTNYFTVNGSIDNYYKGITYDASASFADGVSEKIAPFRTMNMQAFTPALLSGFYADTADVDVDVYEEDARNLAEKMSRTYVYNQYVGDNYEIDEKSPRLNRAFNSAVTRRELAMFPVWFMSYRNGKRVAYVTINGQTGKVAADMPVSILKYLIGCLVLTIPIAVVLNLLLTVTPSVLLGIVSVLAMIMVFLYSRDMKLLRNKEENDDKGIIAKKKKRLKEKYQTGFGSFRGKEQDVVITTLPPKKKGLFERMKGVLIALVLYAIVLVPCACMMTTGSFFDVNGMMREVLKEVFNAKGNLAFIFGVQHVVAAFAMLYAIVMFFINQNGLKAVKSKNLAGGSFMLMVAMILMTAVLYIAPVNDLYYYVAAIVALLSMLGAVVDIILNYNILATRPLPQFTRTGGDDRA